MAITYEDIIANPDVVSTIGLISLDYYKNTYIGEDPDDDVLLTKLIQRASDDINSLCNWELPEDLTDLDDDTVKNLLYKAVAAQADWYVLNGESYNDDSSDSVSIGKFSYSSSYSKSSTNSDKPLCKRAYRYMEQSGYLYRGVNCFG